jgi:CheY-like chemotaxis protein
MAAHHSVDLANLVAPPLVTRPSAFPKPDPAKSRATDFSILFIEHDDEDKRRLRVALKRMRFPLEVNIRIADDCQAALNALIDNSAPIPSIILLNLQREGKPCLEALQRLRSNTRTQAVPVIGWVSEGQRFDEAYGSHINCMLRKGSTIEAIEKSLSRLVNFWTLPNVILPTRP